MGLAWGPLNKPQADDGGRGKHEAVPVANNLIELANAAGRSLTLLQVIKLTYFCHAWMLGLYGRPLLSDRVEAWQYGPVFYSVYRALRQYGAAEVEAVSGFGGGDFDEDELYVIEQVSEQYGWLTAHQLICLTHSPNGPWSQVWDSRTTYIPNEKIRDYFRALADTAGQRTE